MHDPIAITIRMYACHRSYSRNAISSVSSAVACVDIPLAPTPCTAYKLCKLRIKTFHSADFY